MFLIFPIQRMEIPGNCSSRFTINAQTEFGFRIRGFDESIAEAQAGLSRLQSERGILQEQFAISTSIEEMQENLFNYKTNSKLRHSQELKALV